MPQPTEQELEEIFAKARVKFQTPEFQALLKDLKEGATKHVDEMCRRMEVSPRALNFVIDI